MVASTEKQKFPLSTVKELIAEQFPQWSKLPITPVVPGGWDNHTYRLGDAMSIRLPSAEGYVAQVAKEQQWLPMLAPHLSLPIPSQIALGKPSKHYPWHWSIYSWIESESANTLPVVELDLSQLAFKLAGFIKELQAIPTMGGPNPGAHNFLRGAHVSVYEHETLAALAQLDESIDVSSLTSIWKKAVSCKWERDPVWIHGDIASGNLLITEGELTAIIDFGCMGIGDPACDLMIAWTLFQGESREIFQSVLQLDADTWARARGWTLWKLLQQTGPEPIRRQQILNNLLMD